MCKWQLIMFLIFCFIGFTQALSCYSDLKFIWTSSLSLFILVNVIIGLLWVPFQVPLNRVMRVFINIHDCEFTLGLSGAEFDLKRRISIYTYLSIVMKMILMIMITVINNVIDDNSNTNKNAYNDNDINENIGNSNDNHKYLHIVVYDDKNSQTINMFFVMIIINAPLPTTLGIIIIIKIW